MVVSRYEAAHYVVFSSLPPIRPSSHSVGDQVAHQHKTTGKIFVFLNILIFKFLGDEKTKDSELNGSKHFP
jgi:hypothetical protein